MPWSEGTQAPGTGMSGRAMAVRPKSGDGSAGPPPGSAPGGFPAGTWPRFRNVGAASTFRRAAWADAGGCPSADDCLLPWGVSPSLAPVVATADTTATTNTAKTRRNTLEFLAWQVGPFTRPRRSPPSSPECPAAATVLRRSAGRRRGRLRWRGRSIYQSGAAFRNPASSDGVRVECASPGPPVRLEGARPPTVREPRPRG
jgi:hypothetical protein